MGALSLCALGRFGLLVGRYRACLHNYALHIRKYTDDGQAPIKEEEGLRGEYEEGFCTYTLASKEVE